MIRIALTLLFLSTFLLSRAPAEGPTANDASQSLPPDAPLAEGLSFQNATTITAPVNFLDARPAFNADGTVNAVIEIPTGTQAKWEVKEDGVLHWDEKDGKPRIVNYLGYLGNYGMIPRTLQGDGDPIDVLVLAPAYPRGSVVSVRIIGALLFTDDGEQDNKLLAVVPGLPMGDVTSMETLDAEFPEVSHLVKTWFKRYKGHGKEMVNQGQVESHAALQLVRDAAAAYSTKKDSADRPAPARE